MVKPAHTALIVGYTEETDSTEPEKLKLRVRLVMLGRGSVVSRPVLGENYFLQHFHTYKRIKRHPSVTVWMVLFTVSFGCELVVYDPQTSARWRLFVHVRIFDLVLRNGDLMVPHVIKCQTDLCLLCLLVVLCVRLRCPGMLTYPLSQTTALHPLTLVTLVTSGGCLRQQATDEIPPRPSCVFYLRVFRAPVHSKHPRPPPPSTEPQLEDRSRTNTQMLSGERALFQHDRKWDLSNSRSILTWSL